MIHKLAAVSISLVLAGCGQAYILEGQRYESKEAFLYASNKLTSDAVRQITPLSQPLTTKKLVMAIPSEHASYESGVAFITKADGRVPNAATLDVFRNLVTQNYSATKVFYEAVDRKRIYSSVSFRDMSNVVVNLEPSADTDVLYVTAPVPSSAQWFFASQKYGKQVFAFDRSGVGLDSKVNAFVDAVQAQAIRD
jgi:hypothetical protein